MEFVAIIYLIYMFIGMYLTFFFLILYAINRKNLFDIPIKTKDYSLSMVVPCYNEEKDIANTIQSLLDSDYEQLMKIIVVDDCSTDNSYKVIQKYAAKDSRVLAVQTPKNTGCAAGAKNYGLTFVDTELVGFTDADSFPEKDAISKLIGYFDDKKVGVATAAVLVKNANVFFEKLQAIEYSIIVWTRKLLGYVDAIYVTPGPLSIYSMKMLKKIGNFDEKNLTEDIEMTWRVAKHGYKREICLASRVYTTVPNKFKQWYKQRERWNLGGFQTIDKYKSFFFKNGILGNFIVPFFVISLFLGLVGLGVFFFLIFRRIYYTYFFIDYSYQVSSSILAVQDFYITPSVLNFYGLALFILGLVFTLYGMKIMKEQRVKKVGVFSLLFYMVVYLTLNPFILITSVYKYYRGNLSWGTR